MDVIVKIRFWRARDKYFKYKEERYMNREPFRFYRYSYNAFADGHAVSMLAIEIVPDDYIKPSGITNVPYFCLIYARFVGKKIENAVDVDGKPLKIGTIILSDYIHEKHPIPATWGAYKCKRQLLHRTFQ